MKLYSAPVSGNAYKVRLFLSLLGLEHELVPVDIPGGETRSEAFLRINPRGEIPVLVDGDVTLWDSQAILVYLARRYGGEDWLPVSPSEMAQVMGWMSVAQNELLFGLARARAIKRFGRPWNLEQCQEYGIGGLRVLEEHLVHNDWLAVGRPTIADVACYPYVGLSPEAEIALEPYGHVLAWMGRVQALPGYAHMDGIARING